MQNKKTINDRLRKASERTSQYLNIEFLPNTLEDQVTGKNINQLREAFGQRINLFFAARQLEQSEKTAKSINDTEKLQAIEEEKSRLVSQIQALNNLQEFLNDPDEMAKLRPHQKRILLDIRDFLERGETAGYVKCPTGTGKTVIFVKLLQALLGKSKSAKQHQKAKNLRGLVLVPRDNLKKQTHKSFLEHSTLKPRVIGEKETESTDIDITTYQKINTQIARSSKGIIKGGQINPDDYDFIIADEAHRALGDLTSANLGPFLAKLCIGFSATPDFCDQPGRRLGDLLNTQIHSMSIAEAVEAKAICGYQSLVIKTSVDLSDVPITRGEYNQEAIDNKMIDAEGRDQTALELYLGAPNRPEIAEALSNNNIEVAGRSSVIYCSGVKHAEKVKKMFMEAGISAEFIHGETNENEKVRILKEFRQGTIKVLCNADLLIEGFDAPIAKVCYNLRPTLSHINAEQRGGRVLRINPNNPTETAVIIDIIDRDSRNNPLTFAEVAGASTTLGRESQRDTELSAKKDGDEDNARKDKPDLSGTVNIGKITILMDDHSIMMDANQRLKEQLAREKAPIGWSDLNLLCNNFAKTHQLRADLVKRMTMLIQTEGELITKVSLKGKTFIHPDLKEKILRHLNSKLLPESWKHFDELAEELNLTSEQLQTLIEWEFKDQEFTTHQRRGVRKNSSFYEEKTFISPEAVERIKKIKVQAVNNIAPRNWKKMSELKSRLENPKAEQILKESLERYGKGFYDQLLPSQLAKDTVEYGAPIVELLYQINNQTVPTLALEFQTTAEYLNGLILALYREAPEWFDNGNGELAYTAIVDEEIRQFFTENSQFDQKLLKHLSISSDYSTLDEYVAELQESLPKVPVQELVKLVENADQVLRKTNKNSVKKRFRDPQGKLVWYYDFQAYEDLVTKAQLKSSGRMMR